MERTSCHWCGKRIKSARVKCDGCRKKLADSIRQGKAAAQQKREDVEPTEEELDRTIAKQRAKLPSWWSKER